MKSKICDMLGIEFPLVAFSHCRDVVAEVSRAGGFGVLGATAFSPEQLEVELKWIDDHVDGKPYGIDVLIPENFAVKPEEGLNSRTLAERIGPEYKEFVDRLLSTHGIDPDMEISHRTLGDGPVPFAPDEAMRLLEVATDLG